MDPYSISMVKTYSSAIQGPPLFLIDASEIVPFWVLARQGLDLMVCAAGIGESWALISFLALVSHQSALRHQLMPQSLLTNCAGTFAMFCMENGALAR